MPNRILKDSICTSDNIDQLSAFHETVFYRLIVNCDDYGRMDARPKILAARLFPLKDIRASQMEDALRALTSAELVTLYQVDGKPFLLMNTWDKHQQIRAHKSKYPAPEEGEMVSDIFCKQRISDDIRCPRNPIQSESNTESESESNTNTKARARKSPKKSEAFVPPTLDEVRAYCRQRNSSVDPVQFYDYFTADPSRAWIDAKGQPVLNWKQKIVTWEKFNVMPKKSKPVDDGRATNNIFLQLLDEMEAADGQK